MAADNISKFYKALSAKYDNFNSEEDFRNYLSSAKRENIDKLYNAISAKYDNFQSVDEMISYLGWSDQSSSSASDVDASQQLSEEDRQAVRNKLLETAAKRRPDTSSFSDAPKKTREYMAKNPAKGGEVKGYAKEPATPVDSKPAVQPETPYEPINLPYNGEFVPEVEEPAVNVPEAPENAEQMKADYERQREIDRYALGRKDDKSLFLGELTREQILKNAREGVGYSIESAIDVGRKMEVINPYLAESSTKVDEIEKKYKPFLDSLKKTEDGKYIVSNKDEERRFNEFAKEIRPYLEAQQEFTELLKTPAGKEFQVLWDELQPLIEAQNEDPTNERALQIAELEADISRNPIYRVTAGDNAPTESQLRYNILNAQKNLYKEWMDNATIGSAKRELRDKLKAVNAEIYENQYFQGQITKDIVDKTKKLEEADAFLAKKVAELNPNSPAQTLMSDQEYVNKMYEAEELRRGLRKLQHIKDHNASDFFVNMGDVFSDADFWTQGISGISKLITVKLAEQNQDAAGARELLAAVVSRQEAESLESDFVNWIGRAGQQAANMIPFMVGIGVVKGWNSVAKAAENRTEKWLYSKISKEAAERLGTQFSVHMVGATIGDVAAGLVSANTIGVGNTMKNFLERYYGNLQQNEDGTYSFVDGENPLVAFYKAEASQTIEYWSERFGDHLQHLLGHGVLRFAKDRPRFQNMAESIAKTLDTDWKDIGLSTIEKKGVFTTLDKVVDRAVKMTNSVGIQALPFEAIEEEINIIGNAIFTGDNKLSDLVDHDTQVDIWGGMLFSIGGMQAGSLALSGTMQGFAALKNNKTYKMLESNLGVLAAGGEKLLGAERWSEIQSEIDNCANKDMAGIIRRVTESGEYTPLEIDQIRKYIENTYVYRGFNRGALEFVNDRLFGDKPLGSLNLNETVSFAETEIGDAYMLGFQSKESDDAKIAEALETQRQRMSQLFGVEDMSKEQAMELLYSAENGRGTAEAKDALLDYLMAVASAEGVEDRKKAQHNRALAVEDAVLTRRFNGHVYRETPDGKKIVEYAFIDGRDGTPLQVYITSDQMTDKGTLPVKGADGRTYMVGRNAVYSLDENGNKIPGQTTVKEYNELLEEKVTEREEAIKAREQQMKVAQEHSETLASLKGRSVYINGNGVYAPLTIERVTRNGSGVVISGEKSALEMIAAAARIQFSGGKMLEVPVEALYPLLATDEDGSLSVGQPDGSAPAVDTETEKSLESLVGQLVPVTLDGHKTEVRVSKISDGKVFYEMEDADGTIIGRYLHTDEFVKSMQGTQAPEENSIVEDSRDVKPEPTPEQKPVEEKPVIPTDEKTGEHIYDAPGVTAIQAWDAIHEDWGNDEFAENYIISQTKSRRKALEKARKAVDDGQAEKAELIQTMEPKDGEGPVAFAKRKEAATKDIDKKIESAQASIPELERQLKLWEELNEIAEENAKERKDAKERQAKLDMAPRSIRELIAQVLTDFFKGGGKLYLKSVLDFVGEDKRKELLNKYPGCFSDDPSKSMSIDDFVTNVLAGTEQGGMVTDTHAVADEACQMLLGMGRAEMRDLIKNAREKEKADAKNRANQDPVAVASGYKFKTGDHISFPVTVNGNTVMAGGVIVGIDDPYKQTVMVAPDGQTDMAVSVPLKDAQPYSQQESKTPQEMTDEELLAEMSRDESGETVSPEVYEEYDRRHEKEYEEAEDATETEIAGLVEGLVPFTEEFVDAINKVEELYNSAKQEWDNGGWHGPSRAALKARIDAAEKWLASHPKVYEDRKAITGTAQRRPGVTDKQLISRIDKWSKRTGVPVHICRTIEEVDDPDSKKAIEEGVPVAGWYNNETHQVGIYLPNIADAAEVDRTFIHEVVSHRGLREMMGEEGYARLCDRVWNELMTPEQQKEFLAYNERLKGRLTELQMQRAAADEFIAQLSENLDVEDNRNIFEKFADLVKQILDRMLGKKGAEITIGELQSLLRKSLSEYEKTSRRGRRSNEQKRKMESGVGGSVQVNDKGGTNQSRFSISSIAKGAGFTVLKDDGEGNVCFVLQDGRRFNGHNPITAKDLKGLKNTVMSYMMNDAKELGAIKTKKAEDTVWKAYADQLNAMLVKGLSENGGFDHLSSLWEFEVENTVYKTVHSNGDDQYSYSIDITRVCKKNEAVIKAISAMQRRLGYGITPAQILDVYVSGIDEGYQVPCPVCYVFSHYLDNGKYATIAIKGQRKYGDYLKDPSKMTEEEKQEAINFWLEKLHEEEDFNEKNAKIIEQARKDLTDIKDEIDQISRVLTLGDVSEARKERLLKKAWELDEKYRAALDAYANANLTKWIKRFAIHEVADTKAPKVKNEKTGKMVSPKKWVLWEDSYQGFPPEYALDLNLTAETIVKYPAIQRLRKSGGSAAGKEIHFASNNDIGDIQSRLGADLNKAENFYQLAYGAETEEERAEYLKKARERFEGAKKYAQQQTLRGGQRMWSWSDNIERLAADVFASLLQLQMLGGALQSYSKQLEGVNLVASMGGYVNGSLMGKGKGYQELADDDIEMVDGNPVLARDITDDVIEKTRDGENTRHRILAKKGSPVFEYGGKKVTLLFDDVIGIDAYGRDEDGTHKEGLFDLNARLDKAGNILVGMNDMHTRAAMADDRVFFIIPWHASGNSVHVVMQMLEFLGAATKREDLTNYEKVQEEKEAVQENNPINSFLLDFWRRHNYEDRFKCGIKGGIPIPAEGDNKLTPEQEHYRELRNAIFLGIKVDSGKRDKNGNIKYKTVSVRENKAWLKEIMADEFLSQVLRKVEETVESGFMTKGDCSFIYPYEYWNENTTYATADENGERYLEYCRRLGKKPKFTGMLDGRENDFGNFAGDKGYWKLLIDRRMYDVNGNYQWLDPVTTEGYNPDFVDPEWTGKHFTITKVADDEGAVRMADRAIAKEGAAFRNGVPTVNYDIDGQEAVDRYKALLYGEKTGEETGSRFRIRKEAAPKETIPVYKLMRLGEDGKLYPLFIDSASPVELKKWYDADSPALKDVEKLPADTYTGTRTVERDGQKVQEEYKYASYIVDNETGEAMSIEDFKKAHKGEKEFSRMRGIPNEAAVNWATDNGMRWIKIEEKGTPQRRYGGSNRAYYNYGINGSGSVSTYAMRPGWHAGSLPSMRQIGKGSGKNLRDDSFVWVKGYISADKDYNEEANGNPDKDIPTHIPENGYYLKSTNANADAAQADRIGWYVSGSFYPDEIISDDEARSVIDKWNEEHPEAQVEYDWPRESGKVFNSKTMQLEEPGSSRFRLAPNGDVFLDLGDGTHTDHYASYMDAKPSRILNDIDRYFEEGIVPEGNTRFRITKQQREDADPMLDRLGELLTDKTLDTMSKELGVGIKLLPASDMPKGHTTDKGYYNPATGEMSVCKDNVFDGRDAIATVLHESVGYRGLEDILGQSFNNTMKKAYASLDSKGRIWMNAYMNRNNLKPGDAGIINGLAEYLNTLAKDKAYDSDVWDGLWETFGDAIESEYGADDFVFTDNELNYILRASYEYLNNPDWLNTAGGKALDTVMKRELGINESDPNKPTDPEEADISTRFRVAKDYKNAVAEFEADMKNKRNVVMLEFQDVNRIVRSALKAIMKEVKKEDMPELEKFLIRLNLASSKASTKMEEFAMTCFGPMMETVGKIQETIAGKKFRKMKKSEKREVYQRVIDYLYAVSGLERNDYKNGEIEKQKQDALESSRNTAEEERKKVRNSEWKYSDDIQAKLIKEIDDNLAKKEKAITAEYDAKKRDWAGITGLMGYTPDKWREAEADARRMVGYFRDSVKDKLGDTKILDELWDRIRACTDFNLEDAYKNGLLTREEYERLHGTASKPRMWNYYLPLRGFNERTAEDEYGYSTLASAQQQDTVVKKMEGRITQASDPLANIRHIAMTEIEQGVRNWAKQALYEFLFNAGKNSLLSLKNPWFVRVEGEKNKWELAEPNEGESLEHFEKRMNEKKEEGKARRGRTGLKLDMIMGNKGHRSDHIVRMKVNGVEKDIWVNGNPLFARALNGGYGWHNKFTQAVKYANRLLSQMYTTLAPNFIKKNKFRDTQFSRITELVDEGQAYLSRLEKNWWANNKVFAYPMVKLVAQWESGKLHEKEKNGTLTKKERMFMDFMRDGGATGYTIMQSLDDVKRDLDKMVLNAGKKQHLIPIIGWYAKGIGALNEASELLTRFSVYETSRQMDRSGERAAYDAKETSVNFNKRGMQSGEGVIGFAAATAGLLYLFINPAIQGLYKAYQLHKAHPWKMGAIDATYFMLGFVNSMLNAMLAGFADGGGDGDDDDEKKDKPMGPDWYWNIPDWVRRGNMIIGSPFKKLGKWGYLAIPVALEYKAFYAMGEIASSIMQGRYAAKEDKKNLINDLVGVAAEVLPLNPIEGYTPGESVIGSVVRAMTPDVFAPAVNVANNRSFAGIPLWKENKYDENIPNSQTAFESTPALLSNAAIKLAEATYDWWYPIDIHPGAVREVMSGYFGGPYKFVEGLGKYIFADEEHPRRYSQLPYLSGFSGYLDEDRRDSFSSNTLKRYDDMKNDVIKRIRSAAPGYDLKEEDIFEDTEKLPSNARMQSFLEGERYNLAKMYYNEEKAQKTGNKVMKISEKTGRTRMVDEVSRESLKELRKAWRDAKTEYLDLTKKDDVSDPEKQVAKDKVQAAWVAYTQAEDEIAKKLLREEYDHVQEKIKNGIPYEPKPGVAEKAYEWAKKLKK